MIEFEYRGLKVKMADDATAADIAAAKQRIDDEIADQKTPVTPALQTKEWIDKCDSAGIPHAL